MRGFDIDSSVALHSSDMQSPNAFSLMASSATSSRASSLCSDIIYDSILDLHLLKWTKLMQSKYAVTIFVKNWAISIIKRIVFIYNK